MLNAALAQRRLQARVVKRPVAGLVDHDFACNRRELGHEGVSGLAADQKAAERAISADRGARACAADSTLPAAIRQIGRVALTRVHDAQPERASELQQSLRLRQDLACELDVGELVHVAAEVAE